MRAGEGSGTGRRALAGRVLVALWVLVAYVPAAEGTAYLVGAQLYGSSADGTNTGPSSGAYQFSTNASTSHAAFPLNGGAGLAISIGLSLGDNVFTFADLGFGSPGSFAGLNLFFNDTGTSFNPPHTGVGIAGDLAVFSATDGLPGFSVPIGGTNVQSYESDGLSVSSTSYSGSTSIFVGGFVVSVSDFVVDTVPSGSFTVAVVPIPEPSTALLVALGLVVIAGGARARERPSGRSRP